MNNLEKLGLLVAILGISMFGAGIATSDILPNAFAPILAGFLFAGIGGWVFLSSGDK
jgi:hypothetical protein